MPINKKLWTSSYVCFVGGISMMMMSVFYMVIDVLKFRRWTFFFVVIGMNSITVYMMVRIVNFTSIAKFFVGGLANKCSPEVSKLVLAIGAVACVWSVLLFLYRKKVFLKI